MDQFNCPFCNQIEHFMPKGTMDEYYCKRCGTITIETDFNDKIRHEKYENIRHMLSGITRYWKEYELTRIPLIGSNLDEILSTYFIPKDLIEKQDLILKYLEKKSRYPGDSVFLSRTDDYPIGFAKNGAEFRYLLMEMIEEKLIDEPSGNNYLIKRNGWKRLEDLRSTSKESKNGFVAMWFDKSLDEIYFNGIVPAIKKCEYEPIRIDKKEHINKIDDEIIAEIRKSKFLVADFTGNRGGVYFEAGFAMGLNIPVIWTCKKEEIADVHFDTRQFNYIDWSDGEDLKKRLINRINAIIIK